MPADLLCKFFSFLVKVKFSLKSCIDSDTLELTGTNQVAASDSTKFSSKPKLTPTVDQFSYKGYQCEFHPWLFFSFCVT